MDDLPRHVAASLKDWLSGSAGVANRVVVEPYLVDAGG
jgi:hypothetical protein